jgi:hypothetical protein
VIFKGWGFRVGTAWNLKLEDPKIPTLAKPARMGHPSIYFVLK